MGRPVALSRLAGDFKEIVGEQYEYRELLYQMTRRDLLLRYKQTVMGFGWAIFMPLVNTAVFSVIFTRVAPLETDMPVPAVRLLRVARLELFGLVVSFRGDVADLELQPGHEGVLPSRDFSDLRGDRLAHRLRGWLLGLDRD